MAACATSATGGWICTRSPGLAGVEQPAEFVSISQFSPSREKGTRHETAFTKMHGLGNDFVVIDGISQTVALTRSRFAAWPIVISALVAIRCCWWKPLTGPTPIFVTASSTPMAAKSSSAATAPAASPALSATGA
jgi:hypothetical protein